MSVTYCTYISKCVDDVAITRTVKSFPNQKTWMNVEVRGHGENSAGFQTMMSSYREEINSLAGWFTENNLLLNISKTKELIVDFRKKKAKTQTPV